MSFCGLVPVWSAWCWVGLSRVGPPAGRAGAGAPGRAPGHGGRALLGGSACAVRCGVLVVVRVRVDLVSAVRQLAEPGRGGPSLSGLCSS